MSFVFLICQSLWLIQMAEALPSESTDSAAKGREARLECAAGNVEGGIRLLAELWVASRDPTWIYNQGRCYEQNAKNDLAAARFREYLRIAQSLPDDEVQAIRHRIDELQPSVPTSPSAPVNGATPMPGTAATSGTPTVPLLDTSPPANPLTTRPQPTANPPIYARWWVWTAGAAVVGATVAAILLNTRDAPRSPSCDVGALCATRN